MCIVLESSCQGSLELPITGTQSIPELSSRASSWFKSADQSSLDAQLQERGCAGALIGKDYQVNFQGNGLGMIRLEERQFLCS